MRRRNLILSLPALAGACAGREAAPSLQQLPDGRLLVLGPSADFDPNRPPSGWSQLHAERGAVIAVTQEAGRPVLTFDAPGGRALIRTLDLPLTAAPGLSWAWKVETEAFGGGAGDGLPRGLRLTIGFKGGGPTDLIRPGRWTRDRGGFPAHDRRIDIALRGAGAPRAELASVELEALADGGSSRTLRPASRGLTGGWISEFVDLLALFRAFFPQDRFAEVTFAFIAVGALPARPSDGIPAPVGHIVEVQVFR
ncbi:MAG: hypothetical protein FJX57_14995 [Alphaproteobacteria bacterium]|nr:hypothetical protein [Alphaproteobacteria bacterium]